MEPTVSPLDADRLASQTEWLRRLARRLVRDRDLAEDVVQETLLVALQRPPREATTESGLRAWLTGVAQNLARMTRRSEGRRSLRESKYATSRTTTGPAIDDVVERAVQARKLVDAVLALDEPYRSAVLLAYEEQLSAAEIAKRMKVSPEAARKRVSRGLARLRARISKQEGNDGSSWLSGLAVLCHEPKIGPWLWVGGLTVTTKFSAIVATCALVLFVGLWSLGDRNDELSVTADSEVDAAAPTLVTTPSLPEPEPIEGSATEQRTAIASEAPTATSAERVVRGHVLLTDDITPVSGARLRRADGGPHGSTVAPPGEVLATTDAQGSFEFVVAPDASKEWLAGGIWAQHEEVFDIHIDATDLPLTGEQPLEIRTVPLGTIIVHVRDEEGTPLEGIQVVYSLDPTLGSDPQLWSHRGSVIAGTSDVNGDLRVSGLPAAMEVSFGVRGEWKMPARTVIDAQTREVEVVLVPPSWASIRGILQWPDGTPAKSVQVAWHGTAGSSGNGGSSPTGNRELGEFLIPDLSGGGGILMFEGDGFHAPIQLRLEEGQTTDIGTVVVEARVVVEGQVVAAAGRSLPDQLGVAAFRDGVLVQSTLVEEDSGRFSLKVPKGPILLAAVVGVNWDPEMPYRGTSLAEQRVDAPSSAVELTLEATGAGIRGRIEGAQGTAKIAFFDEQASVAWGYAQSERGANPEVGFDGSGVFELSTPHSGRMRVLITLDDGRAAYSNEVELVAGEETNLGTLNTTPGRLTVRVSDEGSTNLEDVTVTLANPSRQERVERTDSNGSVFLEPAAGPYAIRAESSGRTSGVWQLVHVEAGADRSLDLAVVKEAMFTGSVHSPQGPAEGVTLTAQRHKPFSNLSWSATTGRDGRFAFQPLLPGTYRFWISGELVGHVVLRAGEDKELDLGVRQPIAMVELQRDGQPLSWARSMQVTSFDARPHVWRRGEPTGDGRFEIALPEGPLLFQVDLEGLGNNQIVLVPAPERNGATYTLRLPSTGIELRLEGKAMHRPNPAAYFESLNGKPAISSWGENSEVYAEQATDAPGLPYRVVRFPFLVPGAQVKLWGNDEKGGRTSREVRVEANGWTVVRW